MFLLWRKSGSESWYLSMKRGDGRVRYVWSEQEGNGGGELRGRVMRRVGWRPVGGGKDTV